MPNMPLRAGFGTPWWLAPLASSPVAKEFRMCRLRFAPPRPLALLLLCAAEDIAWLASARATADWSSTCRECDRCPLNARLVAGVLPEVVCLDPSMPPRKNMGWYSLLAWSHTRAPPVWFWVADLAG